MLLAVPFAQGAVAAETCRYSGTASQSGRVTVETVASRESAQTIVDVTVRLEAMSFGVIGFRYWHQEIGVWRGGELASVAVNHRYSFNGSIVRQQWDVFRRGPDGMTAYRVQAKTLADFRRGHPAFVGHWDPASFGRPWLAEYDAAAPERRPDLDLPRAAIPADMGTPLALAFYWVRWNEPDKRLVPVFLPGFKHDARIDVPVTVIDASPGGARHVRAEVRHPGLGGSMPSTGDAWISADPDHRLVRVTLDAHATFGGAHAELGLMGCHGNPTGTDPR